MSVAEEAALRLHHRIMVLWIMRCCWRDHLWLHVLLYAALCGSLKHGVALSSDNHQLRHHVMRQPHMMSHFNLLNTVGKERLPQSVQCLQSTRDAGKVLRLRGSGDTAEDVDGDFETINQEWEKANEETLKRGADLMKEVEERARKEIEDQTANVTIVDGDELFDPKKERYNRTRSKPVEDEVIFHKGDMDGLLSMLSGGEEAVEGGDAAGGSSDAEPALDMGSDHWGPSEECWRDGDPVAAQRAAEIDESSASGWALDDDVDDSAGEVVTEHNMGEEDANGFVGSQLSHGCSGFLKSFRSADGNRIADLHKAASDLSLGFVFVGNLSSEVDRRQLRDDILQKFPLSKVTTVEQRESDPRAASLFGGRGRKRGGGAGAGGAGGAGAGAGEEERAGSGAASVKRLRGQDAGGGGGEPGGGGGGEEETGADRGESVQPEGTWEWLARMGIKQAEVKVEEEEEKKPHTGVRFGPEFPGVDEMLDSPEMMAPIASGAKAGANESEPDTDASARENTFPYLLVEFQTRAQAVQSLEDIREVTRKWRAEAVCAVAWGEEEHVSKAITRARTREEVVELLSRQMEMGLPAMSGQLCATALVHLSRLRPTQFEERFKPKKVQERLPKAFPLMPKVVSPAYQPDNIPRCRQQELVAALLERVLLLASTMSTRTLSSVLRVATSLEQRGLELPSGVDWRVSPPVFGEGIDPSQPFFVRAEGAYGYIGLKTRVISTLSKMRGGTVLEGFTGWPASEIPYQVRVNVLSRHAQKKRDYPSLHPFVPGRYFEGHDHVLGAYTARSGGGAALREWLGNGPDRATLPECDLRRIARKMDQNIAKAERKYWRAYMGTKHGVFGDKEIEEFMVKNKMRNWTDSMIHGSGGARVPLEVFWMDNVPLRDPPGAPPPEDAEDEGKDEWRPANLTLGMQDPLFGRWMTKELPPHVRPLNRLGNMTKTTELHLRGVRYLKRKGRPYVECNGGVKMPDDPEMIRKICTPEPIENLRIRSKKKTREEIELLADPGWSERRKEKAARMMQMARRVNHTLSSELQEDLVLVCDDMLDPTAKVTKQGFERAEDAIHHPLRLRGFGPESDEESEDEKMEDRVQQKYGDERWDSIYQKYFLGPEEWEAKAKSVLDRLMDEQGPMFKGTTREKKQLASDLAEQISGHTLHEWMVMRVMRTHKQRLRHADNSLNRTEGEEEEGAFGFPSDDDLMLNYSNFDMEANEQELRQLIVNEKLMQAVDNEDPLETEELLDAGADVNYFDAEFHFCSPIHLAATHEEPILLRLLMSRGARVHALDARNSTALHDAASLGNTEIMVELVSQFGADVNAVDSDERTPLHICAGRGFIESVQALLAMGANPDPRSNIGDSPLMAAAAWGQVHVMRELLDHGADPNATNHLMVSPLEIVREYGYQDAEELLLERGVADMDLVARRWDAFWEQLEDAARRGLLGEATRINATTARRHAKILTEAMEKLKTDPNSPFSHFLQEFMPSEPPVPTAEEPDEETDEVEALMEMKALRDKVKKRSRASKRARDGQAASACGESGAAHHPGVEESSIVMDPSLDPRYALL